MMIAKRKLAPILKKYVKKYPVILLTGPRQSGKTTLIRSLFPNFFYANLESPDIRLVAQEDPRGFLAKSSKMIIDEVQKVPELLSYIQSMVDTNKHLRFILTGSQNILLLSKAKQSLAGRVALFRLFPFDLGELEKAGWKKRTPLEQIIFGSYPPIYSQKLNPQKWYLDYIATYLERDVRDLINVKNMRDFTRFLRLAAGRTGQILNLSSLAIDIGVSVNTIREWLSVLEASYIIFFLNPYYRNFNKRIIKSPKLYFYDTGIVTALLGIKSVRELANHPLRGSIFETFIIAEIKKWFAHQDQNIDFYFWRERSGREIDLLYEDGGKICAYEIKATHTFSPKLFSNIDYFAKLSQEKVVGKVIFAGDKGLKFKEYALVPWDKILK